VQDDGLMARRPSVRGARHVLLGIVGVLALTLGVGVGIRVFDPGTGPVLRLEGGEWLPRPMPLPDFRLADMWGEAFIPAALEGQWTFLFFGYTHCPDICPVTTLLLGQATEQIRRADPAGAVPRIVFVSVDPDRDTPEVLRQFVTHFHPEAMGVTAPLPELLPFTRALGIVHRKVQGNGDPDRYLVDHSGSILLINPEGRLQAVFPWPHEADTLRADFLQIRARAPACPPGRGC
jgi:protein SCO1